MKTLSIIILLYFSMTSFAQKNPAKTLVLPNLKPLINWQAIVEMDNRIYPSYVWATSNFNYLNNPIFNPYYYGDDEGQVGITFKNHSNKQSNIKLVIEAPEIMRKLEYSCFVSQNDKEVEIFPEIDYIWEVLSQNYQPRPVLIKFTLYVDGKFEYTKTQQIILESIYECPYAFYHRSGVLLDQNFMFAAYVNENHPKINDEILPAITSSGIVRQITGYLDYSYKGDAAIKDVLRQVFGVWNTLRNKDIRYSSITGVNTSEKVIDQHVRTIDQTLISSHANCIDGTVLMASILYKMGIEPMIVLVPGHAYLGFHANPASSKNRLSFFIETTMLGATVEESKLSTNMVSLGNSILDKDDVIMKKYKSSFLAFLAALDSATSDYKKNANLFNKQDIGYRVFEVNTYRKAGLLPLNH